MNLPSRNDVIIQKYDNKWESNPGNIRLNFWVLETQEEGYDTWNDDKKERAIQDVIDKVHSKGGCFVIAYALQGLDPSYRFENVKSGEGEAKIIRDELEKKVRPLDTVSWGRGHTANRRYHQTVQAKFPDYIYANKTETAEMVKSIEEELNENGFKFLETDPSKIHFRIQNTLHHCRMTMRKHRDKNFDSYLEGSEDNAVIRETIHKTFMRESLDYWKEHDKDTVVFDHMKSMFDELLHKVQFKFPEYIQAIEDQKTEIFDDIEKQLQFKFFKLNGRIQKTFQYYTEKMTMKCEENWRRYGGTTDDAVIDTTITEIFTFSEARDDWRERSKSIVIFNLVKRKFCELEADNDG